MKKLRLMVVFLLLAGVAANAGIERSDTKESLRGLSGVYVVSQFIDIQPEGLATNRIEKMVKTMLNGAGVPVDAEPNRANGDPNLSISVDTIKQPQLGVYVFMVEVAVTQDVQLTRRPHSAPVAARTWSKTIQGITTPDRTDVIEEALKQGVNRFIADYRAMNPGTAD
ncbi:MAG TPA: hypothetical protein VKV04_03765 [Verrucomicrobiae bacterium]|nr:hypothetical protein [Verrucomicrobiae bacterium]